METAKSQGYAEERRSLSKGGLRSSGEAARKGPCERRAALNGGEIFCIWISHAQKITPSW